MPSSASQSASSEQTRPNPEAARPSSFAAIPGWMISGMLHAAVIVFLITSGVPSCGDGQLGTGAAEGEFRDVGIFVKSAPDTTETPNEDETEEQNDESQNVNQSADAKPNAAKAAEKIAEDLIDLPDVKPRTVIGESRGGPTEIGAPSISEDALVTPNAVRSTPPSKGQGPGNISFMGQTTKAQSVVYVIDTSSSMDTNDAMKYAKAKLKKSINGLAPTQSFQIVTYNTVPTVMRLVNDRSGGRSLYRANGPNVTLTTRFINGIVANGGTKHKPALEAAFHFEPDVIFFLTDADTQLSPGELNEVRTNWNRGGKTHIHCIKFGEGPDLTPASENFLRTLANQNRGSYSYLDISRLETP